MMSTVAFIARFVGLFAAAIATLAVAVGLLGMPPAQAGNGPGASHDNGAAPRPDARPAPG